MISLLIAVRIREAFPVCFFQNKVFVQGSTDTKTKQT